MPTFCRHNRFIERCPICRVDLPGTEATVAGGGGGGGGRANTARRAGSGNGASRGGGRGGAGSERVRVSREERAVADGYGSPLLPGIRSSADALRLAQETAFAHGRLLALTSAPPDFYGQLRALAGSDLVRATWGCFLTAYISPLEDGDDPFVGIREAFATDVAGGELPDLQHVALGPRTSVDRARASETLGAYLQWTQRESFAGDPSWTAERRFQRVFERLALPGFGRAPRYELLVLLGRLGLFELRADSLGLATAARGSGAEDDLTTQAAKRVFAIGDALLLERRAAALAEEAEVPVEALDLALANWAAGERASLGFPPETLDEAALERVQRALRL